MSIFEIPENLARDAIWGGSIKRMFETLAEQDDQDPMEMVGDDYLIIGPSPEVLMIVRLPEGYENMSEDDTLRWIADVASRFPSDSEPNAV